MRMIVIKIERENVKKTKRFILRNGKIVFYL